MMRKYNKRDDDKRMSNSMSQKLVLYPGVYPLVKTKDVVCTFCKHRFYIGNNLKSNNSPLLLPCGHATCSNCESTNPSRSCTICLDQSTNSKPRERLPYNIYITGLVHAITSGPLLNVDEPDITFCSSNNLAQSNIDQGYCNECGMIAYYECKDCKVLFCNSCFKKIHGKALKNHQAISLNKSAVDLPESNCCPNHEMVVAEYYCKNCESEFCSHCIITNHAGHKTLSHEDRNQELLPEFNDALMKLQETRMRIHQTQKSFNEKIVCLDAIKESQEVENKITQHFIRCHGVLQNLENQLKKELLNHRRKLQHDVEEIRNKLAHQEEQLTSAISLASTVEPNLKRVDLKNITERLLTLANFPCHVIQNENINKSISMEIDNSVFDNINQHIQLYVPEGPNFNLKTTDQLPEDHELEPLAAGETLNLSFKMNVEMNNDPSSAISTQSLTSEMSSPSRSPSNSSLNESFTEPSSLEKGSVERVKVSYIKTPVDFYVQRQCTSKMLQDIEANINKHMKQEAKNSPPEEIILKRVYLVQNSELSWRRGRVLELACGLNGETTYKVFYIDYGVTEENVEIDRFRENHPKFNVVTSLAVHCTLKEIAPVFMEWDEDVTDQFRHMVAGQVLSMHVISINDLMYTVDLQKLNCYKNNVSIRDWLIDTKLAKPTTYYKLKRMNPISAQHFYYEDLPIDKYTKVTISYVESPDCIYVNKKSKEYHEQMELFRKRYKEFLREKNNSFQNLEYGDLVAIRTHSSYQRGIITTMQPDLKKMDVFFVDTGFTGFVDEDKVTKLPNRFSQWNAQAIKVSLVDIKPMHGEEWSTEVINYLKTNLEGRNVKIIPVNKTEYSYESVILTEDDTNINANLVSSNLAMSTGNHSKHATLNKEISTSKKQRKKSKKAKTKNSIEKNEPTPSPKKRSPKKIIEESDPFRVRVLINKIVSPDEIHVSEVSNLDRYEQMNSEMQKFYESHACTWEEQLQTNLYYAAYSRKDKQYCRAQLIEESSDPCMMKMLLVDLAEIEEIPVHQIQPLDRQFLDVPKYIFKVSLGGIRPCGGTNVWQSTSCEKLKEIINDTGDTKYYITLVGSLENEEVMPVDLFIRRNIVTGPTEPNKKETLSVARRMVEQGVALPIRGYSENIAKTLAVELKKKLKLDSSHFETTASQTSDSNNTMVGTDSTFDSNNDVVEEEETPKISEDLEETTLDTSSDSATLPPKISAWVPAAHIQETTFTAEATYVDYDCNVYFHPNTKEYKDTLRHISDTLMKHYDNRSIKSYDHIWKEGDLCVACYHNDKKWYRGQVVQVQSSQHLKVFFVDYGNIEICHVGSVKKRIILTDVPIQATKASIVGIKPMGMWREKDLDIIHKLIVTNPCKLKAVSKSPKPWKVAIWLIENSSFYPLPWYLQNKTQVMCIVEDINIHYYDDVSVDLNSTKDEKSDEICKNIERIVILNDNDSSESSDECDSSQSNVASNNSDTSNSCKEDHSTTLRNNEELSLDITTFIKEGNSSKNNSFGSSKKSSVKSRILNGQIDELNIDYVAYNGKVNAESQNSSIYEENCDELLTSSLTHFHKNLDNFHDVQSVRSECVLEDFKEGNLVVSTPLNDSFQSIPDEFSPQYIDFSRYNIKSFKVGIGEAISETKMYGYIIDSPDQELNQWIALWNKHQEKLQLDAEERPIFEGGSHEYCIARYCLDKKWYRAYTWKCISDKDKNKYCVEFIDFGNRLLINIETDIREINKEWLNFPRMSFPFQLYNVKSVPEDCKEIRAITSSILNQSEEYYAIVKNYEPLEVELYLDEDCKHLVYAPLIESNFMEIIDPDLD